LTTDRLRLRSLRKKSTRLYLSVLRRQSMKGAFAADSGADYKATGLLDPEIVVKPVKGQIDDLIGEISERVQKNQRVMITTLTKKMAEDLTDYLRSLTLKLNICILTLIPLREWK